MKNLKFTVVIGGQKVRIAPDYRDGGRGNGPIGWVEMDGSRTASAVSVGRNWQVCQAHSIKWSDPLEEGSGLSEFMVDGQEVSAVEFDRLLGEECCY
jgi:hypothetical protein